jgi:hypothetical protein
MQEISLIEFLKTEIDFFRELLSSFMAEELAYKDSAHDRLFTINYLQKQLFAELKKNRPQKFQAFNLQDDVEVSVLNSLKDQLDTLVERIKFQIEKNLHLKKLEPQQKSLIKPKHQVIVETLEEEC